MEIDQSGVNVHMAEEFFERKDVSAHLEQVGGIGVAQAVSGDLLLDAAGSSGFTGGPLYASGTNRDWFASTVIAVKEIINRFFYFQVGLIPLVRRSQRGTYRSFRPFPSRIWSIFRSRSISDILILQHSKLRSPQP